MFVKVKNGQASKYPYTLGDLRRENPGTSFPKVIQDDVLAAYGVYRVEPATAPKFDNKTHLVSDTVENISGMWTQKWLEKRLPEDRASINVRRHRSLLLKDTDYFALTDVTMDTAIVAYRQALRDITNHVNFPYLAEEDWPIKP